MAKESCSNCATKMSEPVSFCTTCDRPTRHANDAERLDWDLKQWRAHVDRSVAAGVIPNGASVRAPRGVIVAAEKAIAPVARPTVIRPKPTLTMQRIVDATVAKPSEAPPESPPERERPSGVRIAKLRLPRRKARTEPEVVIDLDADDAFAYRACVTCQATDWILRTSRNDDGTWNYWCVRCSRSFKTEVKLRHAVKPFLSVGIVFGGLAAASILILH